MSVTLRGGVRPSLLARDMRETLAFYEGLGFQLDGCFPDKESPQWMALHRGEARLMFYCEPHSVDLLAAEWNGKVEFCWGPGLMDYGWYEFGIRDPNGYYLAFAQEWELEGEPVDSGG
jgi:catechol 2,3-dioxygenase-like lactoylglutathione lyase family enzyme